MLAAIAVPFFLNVIVLTRIFLLEARHNIRFLEWYKEHAQSVSVLFLLGAVRPDMLRHVIRCFAFKLSFLLAPISSRALSMLQAAGLIANVLGDLPKLVLVLTTANDPLNIPAEGGGLPGRVSRWEAANLPSLVATISVIELVFSCFTRLAGMLAIVLLSDKGAPGVREEENALTDDKVADPTLMEWLIAREGVSVNVPGAYVKQLADVALLTETTEQTDTCPILRSIAPILLTNPDCENDDIVSLAREMGGIQLSTASIKLIQQVLDQFSRTYGTAPARVSQNPDTTIMAMVDQPFCEVELTQHPNFYSSIAQKLCDALI